ncbi:MAG: YhbY family RNA-binding protein [Nevskiales bacterium]
MPTQIPAEQRRALKARAHALKPVVTIGNAGLTDAVVAELGASLAHHELMKLRLPATERPARTSMIETLCTRLDAAPIQQLGFVLTVYRKKPVKKPKKPKRAKPKPVWVRPERRTERDPRPRGPRKFQRGGAAPKRVRS